MWIICNHREKFEELHDKLNENKERIYKNEDYLDWWQCIPKKKREYNDNFNTTSPIGKWFYKQSKLHHYINYRILNSFF